MGLERYLTPFDAGRLPLYRFDLVVVGTGAAGSAAALAAAQAGCSVAMVAKDLAQETNTRYAQGGIAAVLDPSDSVAAHVRDTLDLGCGLSELETVESVVREGPTAVRDLLDWGAQFDRRDDGELDLSREGGHSQPRIVHAGGAATGREIQRTLARVVDDSSVTCFAQTFVVDILTSPEGRAVGVLCMTERGELVVFGSPRVVLAAGGSGQIYRETTNPAIATGDGIAMALRAGASLRDLEFVQFHPTCLYIAGAARVLISEIVRGAGGLLRDREGVRFMPDYSERAELAPRDVVSRACFDRMVSTGDTSVYLDLSELDRDPHQLFPGISRICRYFGIDIARDPIPVRPGAHYHVGGIAVDLDGRTEVPGLWAAGECASSGLHGANRMGSNSLLEGLVLGRRAGLCAAQDDATLELGHFQRRLGPPVSEAPDDVQLSLEDLTYSLKSLMWRQMGIVRNGASIEDAIAKITFWTRAVSGLRWVEPRAWELMNMLTVARMTAIGALSREESRGTHYRSDFQQSSDEWRAHTVLAPVFEGGELARAELHLEPVHESSTAVS